MPLFKKLLSSWKKLFKRPKSRRKKRTHSTRLRTRSKSKKKNSKRSKPAKAKISSRKPRPALRTNLRKGLVKAKALSHPLLSVKAKKAKIKPTPELKKTLPLAEDKMAAVAPIGEITHYFSKIMVCVIQMNKGTLSIGEKVRIRGHTTDFTQKIRSLQIESVNVPVVHQGQLVGMRIDKPARAGDMVFKEKGTGLKG